MGVERLQEPRETSRYQEHMYAEAACVSQDQDVQMLRRCVPHDNEAMSGTVRPHDASELRQNRTERIDRDPSRGARNKDKRRPKAAHSRSFRARQPAVFRQQPLW
jgi:hypothetical protein